MVHVLVPLKCGKKKKTALLLRDLPCIWLALFSAILKATLFTIFFSIKEFAVYTGAINLCSLTLHPATLCQTH